MLKTMGISSIRLGGSFTDPSYYFWCVAKPAPVPDTVFRACSAEHIGDGAQEEVAW